MSLFSRGSALAEHVSLLGPVIMSDGNEPVVYIVDQDEAVRDALSASLRANGLTVQTFEKGQSFLDAPKPGEKGCLLIEYDLLDMTGMTLVDHLAARQIRLPAIIMSRRLRKPALGDPAPAGIVAFLQKPFGQEEVLATLRLAFGRSP